MTIAFAHIELVIDFTTREEAEAYKAKHSGKGWHFEKIEYNDQIDGYTMIVRRPYRDYLPGW